MAATSFRTEREIAEIYERHVKTLYRVCFAYMKCAFDTEDAVQETFCKMVLSGMVFESKEHEKAWLIRVASNMCKNKLRHWWRKRENLDDHEHLEGYTGIEVDETIGAVIKLPDKYKDVVYLYYYEGYDSVEISAMLRKPQSTIRNYLHEARRILKMKLGDNFNEE